MSDPVRVLLFAAVREAVGASEVSLDPRDAATAGDVLESLCQRSPGLRAYVSSLRVAVNGTYVGLDEPVRAGDEIAVIPPVAGG